MKKKVLVVAGMMAACVVWLWATGAFMPRIVVKDVRQPETLVIGQATGNPHTYAITILGSGDIDGQATISLLLNGEPYKIAKLTGVVDFEWGGDWYSEIAEIQYEPTNARSGHVVLHYQFHQ